MPGNLRKLPGMLKLPAFTLIQHIEQEPHLAEISVSRTNACAYRNIRCQHGCPLD